MYQLFKDEEEPLFSCFDRVSRIVQGGTRLLLRHFLRHSRTLSREAQLLINALTVHVKF